MSTNNFENVPSQAQDLPAVPTPNSSVISKIELAKALKTLRDILPMDVYGNVQQETLKAFPEFSASQAEAELNRSLTGLSAEDDFAMLCRLMQTARHIVRLEQRPLVSPKPDVPDFLINFRYSCRIEEKENGLRGYSYLIDVKQTEADKKKISGESLRRLRNFAQRIGFPLIFAVRFDRTDKLPCWSIVEDRDQTTSSITIHRNDPAGIGHLLWADMGVVMPKGTFFKAFFDQDSSDGRFLHPTLGGLLGLHFIYGKGEVMRIDEVESRLRVYVLFSQIAKVAWTNTVGSRTVEVMVANKSHRLLSDLVQVFNSIQVDDTVRRNKLFNPSRILPRLDVDPYHWLITRTQLDNYIRDLARKGIVQIAAYPGTPLQLHLQRLGKVESTKTEDLPDFEPEE